MGQSSAMKTFGPGLLDNFTMEVWILLVCALTVHLANWFVSSVLKSILHSWD